MKPLWIVLIGAALLVACTPDSAQTPKIAGSQREALDKAKAVDAQMQQNAETTRRNIDEQSQ